MRYGEYDAAAAHLRTTGRTSGNSRVNVELRRAELALNRGDDAAARTSIEEAEALLVDSHDAPVSPAVWSLYERLIARIGPRPTLIERDGNLPAFDVLQQERWRAEAVLRAPARRAA